LCDIVYAYVDWIFLTIIGPCDGSSVMQNNLYGHHIVS
jgi:hypothetical protein